MKTNHLGAFVEISTTVKVCCDVCGNSIEIEWECLPTASNIISNLVLLQWATVSDDGGNILHFCPNC